MIHFSPSDDDDDYGDLFPEVRHLRRFFRSLHRLADQGAVKTSALQWL